MSKPTFENLPNEVAELKQMVQNLTYTVSALVNSINEAKKIDKDDLMKAIDVAEYLDISLPTVHSWANKGILKRHKVGTMTYFKREEVIKALNEV